MASAHQTLVTNDFEKATGQHGRTRYVLHDGVGWTVYERTWSDYDRRSATRLVFESEGAVRIVRGFPAEWYLLTDAELVSLSWRR
jgi:hypothetical protein